MILQVEEALLPIATAEADAAKAEGAPPALIFFTVKSEASLPKQVRNVCDLKTVSDSPQVRISCGARRLSSPVASPLLVLAKLSLRDLLFCFIVLGR